LGFDPSLTNFGWALYNTELAAPSRCVVRGRFQTFSKMLFIDRYTEMRANVRDVIQRLGVKRLGVEYPVFKDLYSEGMYGLFLYTCEAMRAEKVDVVFFSPMQVKVHARLFLGRPDGWKMGKPDMVEAAKKAENVVMNHNEADAFWVARVASRFWQFHDGEIKVEDLTPVEAKQFLEVKKITRGKRSGETDVKGILFREDERFFRWTEEHNGTTTES
jgi:Holliday junction resolvasome RuvABC endonuclease subunit